MSFYHIVGKDSPDISSTTNTTIVPVTLATKVTFSTSANLSSSTKLDLSDISTTTKPTTTAVTSATEATISTSSNLSSSSRLDLFTSLKYSCYAF